MLHLVCYRGAECHVAIHNLHSTLFSQALASASDVRTEQPSHPVPSIDDIKAKPPTLSFEVSPPERFRSHCGVLNSQLKSSCRRKVCSHILHEVTMCRLQPAAAAARTSANAALAAAPAAAEDTAESSDLTPALAAAELHAAGADVAQATDEWVRHLRCVCNIRS
jgi:hypothetical protein